MFNLYFCSSSKCVQGLAPTISEEVSLKLFLSNKIKFIGPPNQENLKEEVEGTVNCYFRF